MTVLFLTELILKGAGLYRGVCVVSGAIIYLPRLLIILFPIWIIVVVTLIGYLFTDRLRWIFSSRWFHILQKIHLTG